MRTFLQAQASFLLLVPFTLLWICHGLAADADRFILRSDRLPDDLNFMPSLSNGHLGFTVYGDSIFMNGIYNGMAGNSRRARIPNWLNFSIQIGNRENKSVRKSYEMNLRKGYFESYDYYQTPDLIVSQKFYPHRFYNRALVHEIHILRKQNRTNELLIKVKPSKQDESKDFDFIIHEKGNYTVIHGRTREKEDPELQSKLHDIYIASVENIFEEKILVFEAMQRELFHNYVITIDTTEEDAVQELFYVLAMEPKQLRRKHSRLWKRFLSGFSIEVANDKEMNQILAAGIFYLASSLPSLNSFRPNHRYYGLSPTGLGRGHLDADYQGHSFWDTEIWMFPVVLQMSSAWARELLEYRFRHLKGAIQNARKKGGKGARFPWESAFSGVEVVNACCPEVAAQQIHISADIILAIELYFSATGHTSWLCSKGWTLIYHIAVYLESRVEWSADNDIYYVKDVMGPDEDHRNVNNNVYTNYAFKRALQFAQFSQDLCQKQVNATAKRWLDISRKMFLPYDAKWDYHPEYENYMRGTKIKQADTILLNYPLQMPMNQSTLLNDLRYYEKVMRASGPAMTWSMFAINYIDAEEYEKADLCLLKNKNYIRPEFKVWSEVGANFNGSANFLTGVGGFLQVFINGFLGIRFTHDGPKSVMLINGKQSSFTYRSYIIRGLKFSGAVFDFNCRQDGKSLEIRKLGTKQLKLFTSKGVLILKVGKRVILREEQMRIETF